MAHERKNLQVLAIGPTGSGKNHALHELYTKDTPRVLTIDSNDEVKERNPDAIRTFGLASTLKALTRCAQHREWHIAAMLQEEELPTLARILCPPIISEDSTSFPAQIGGMAVEIPEGSIIVPSGRTPREVKRLFTDGRHYCVSSYVATQRVALCDLALTSGAHVVQIFRTNEAADLGRLQKMYSRAIAAAVRELEKYHSLYIVKATGVVYWLDPEFQVLRTTDTQGEELEGDPIRLAA